MQSYKARTTGWLLRWSGEAQVNASEAVLEGARASLDGRGPGAGAGCLEVESPAGGAGNNPDEASVYGRTGRGVRRLGASSTGCGVGWVR